MKNKSEKEDFIDWAIKEKKRLKGKRREIQTLDILVALAKRSRQITERDQKRYNES